MSAILKMSLKWRPCFKFRTDFGGHVSNFARALVVMFLILHKMTAILIMSQNGGRVFNFALD